MSILRSIESTIGGIVEGTFGRLFRSEVRPMELAHKLTREMDEHRTTSVSRVYAPNEFLVWLSPEDRAHHANIEDELIGELCAYLLEHARREELTLVSRPVVTFHTDEDLTLGEFGIQARLVRLAPDGEPLALAEGEEEGDRAPALEEPDDRGHTMIYSASERSRTALGEARTRSGARAFVQFAGKRQMVGPGGAVLGRSRASDIVVEDSGVSRRHAEIRPDGDGWTIRDLGSTNGVLVNRAPIEGPVELRSGDRIELGETEILFEAP
ncbi:MAG: FHA domain-containing protein [Acidobacteriota bacterium]|nr:FHA domain-containing protein [Acidobacteriota bacterium]